MNISRTLDYAVRSLTYMGAKPIDNISMKEISENQYIPINYLAKIMRRLVKRGLVRSMVGPSGGYSLRRTPNEINLKDIYEAVEGEIRLIECMEDDKICRLYEGCPQLPVWDKVQVSFVKILRETTLEDMVKGNINKIDA